MYITDPSFILPGLFFLPFLAYPVCPTYCKRCGKEIGSFFILSENMYCKECKPLLTDEEKAREKRFSEIVRMLMKLNTGKRLVLPRHLRQTKGEEKNDW